MRGAPAPVPTALKRLPAARGSQAGIEPSFEPVAARKRSTHPNPQPPVRESPPGYPLPPTLHHSPPALVHPPRMLSSSAIGLQLPPCTAKAGRRPSPASTDSAANRRERPPPRSQSPRRGGGPSCAVLHRVIPPQPVGVSATSGLGPAPSPGSRVPRPRSPER